MLIHMNVKAHFHMSGKSCNTQLFVFQAENLYDNTVDLDSRLAPIEYRNTVFFMIMIKNRVVYIIL